MVFAFDEKDVISREIDRVLTVSTCHMSQQDSHVLRNHINEICPLVSYKYEEGDFIILNDIEEKLPEIKKHFSSSFVGLILLAQKHDCQILRLDRDGPVYDDLPTFVW